MLPGNKCGEEDWREEGKRIWRWNSSMATTRGWLFFILRSPRDKRVFPFGLRSGLYNLSIPEMEHTDTTLSKKQKGTWCVPTVTVTLHLRELVEVYIIMTMRSEAKHKRYPINIGWSQLYEIHVSDWQNLEGNLVILNVRSVYFWFTKLWMTFVFFICSCALKFSMLSTYYFCNYKMQPKLFLKI